MTSHEGWFSRENCSVARALEIIGERWTILVIREAFHGVRRFDDFQRNIGCARNILSLRLQTLVENGIMERRRYSDRPPRFEYRLTQKGIDLYPAVVALLEWGDRYLADEAGPAVVLEHKDCGHESTPYLACSACGEAVEARAMRAKPGPGALRAPA